MITIRNVKPSSGSWPCPRCGEAFVIAADHWPFDLSDPSRPPSAICLFCATIALPSERDKLEDIGKTAGRTIEIWAEHRNASSRPR